MTIDWTLAAKKVYLRKIAPVEKIFPPLPAHLAQV